jgi:ABC-type lipopolysaccharide export system ATPase subunit
METLAEHRCFGGVQGFYRHMSEATGTPMKFGVFTPPGAKKAPVVYFLAGLTQFDLSHTLFPMNHRTGFPAMRRSRSGQMVGVNRQPDTQKISKPKQ